MYLISAEGYKSADVHILIIEKSGEIWVSMKNVNDGLGVKNMSHLVLKEFVKQKTLRKGKFKNTK